MIVTRRGALELIGGSAIAGSLGTGAAWAQAKQPQIGVVVKIGGIPVVQRHGGGHQEGRPAVQRQCLDDRAPPRPTPPSRCAPSRT